MGSAEGQRERTRVTEDAESGGRGIKLTECGSMGHIAVSSSADKAPEGATRLGLTCREPGVPGLRQREEMQVSPRSLSAFYKMSVMMPYGSRSTFAFIILSHLCKDHSFLRTGLLLIGPGGADVPDSGVGSELHEQSAEFGTTAGVQSQGPPRVLQ